MQTQAIMQLPTLPKLLVPNLPSIRRSVYAWLNRRNHRAIASGTPRAANAAAASSSELPVLEKSADSLVPTVNSFLDAGAGSQCASMAFAAVLEMVL